MSTSTKPIIEFFLSGSFPEGNSANSRIKAISKYLYQKGYPTKLNFLMASSFNDSGINTTIKGTWENIAFEYLNKSCKRPKSIRGKLLDNIRSWIHSTIYILKKSRQHQIFYLYSPDVFYYWHIYLLARLLNKKIIIEQTELKSSFRDRRSRKSRFLHWANTIDEHYSQHFCDELLVISKNLQTHYKDYFHKERIHLIPITVDLLRFESNWNKQKGLIGYLGSFGYKDGVDGIIEAFNLAKNKMPELRLRLIGYCERFDEIKQRIELLGLAPYIELTGLVLYDEIPKLIGACDLLLMNRIDTKFANYGSPTKLAEYLASASPTIVTNVGDIKDYLTHDTNTYIIAPEDPISLSKAILLRYEESEKFDKIGTMGKIACQQYFSDLVIGKKVEEVLEKLS